MINLPVGGNIYISRCRFAIITEVRVNIKAKRDGVFAPSQRLGEGRVEVRAGIRAFRAA